MEIHPERKKREQERIDRINKKEALKPRYAEIDWIKKVPSQQHRIMLYLEFLQEYGGQLQHLEAIGLTWGAGGEEVRVNREWFKTKEHLELLKSTILEDLGLDKILPEL